MGSRPSPPRQLPRPWEQRAPTPLERPPPPSFYLPPARQGPSQGSSRSTGRHRAGLWAMSGWDSKQAPWVGVLGLNRLPAGRALHQRVLGASAPP